MKRSIIILGVSSALLLAACAGPFEPASMATDDAAPSYAAPQGPVLNTTTEPTDSVSTTDGGPLVGGN